MDPVALAAQLHDLLQEHGETIASAESLTGGALADLLSGTPGASASYVGGVVSYATSVKESVLGVPAALVAEHGVVSEECAAAMAAGARDLLGATWAVSTTGVAGPTEQEGQPVGTVFVGIAGPIGVTVSELALDGDRETIRAQTCALALDQLVLVVRTQR
jgi:nicotinamide-nucleotide amidase